MTDMEGQMHCNLNLFFVKVITLFFHLNFDKVYEYLNFSESDVELCATQKFNQFLPPRRPRSSDGVLS